jgi:hypothetical protein
MFVTFRATDGLSLPAWLFSSIWMSNGCNVTDNALSLITEKHSCSLSYAHKM